MAKKKTIKKLSDCSFDKENANKHTMRGMALVEESLTKLGAGRSVLVDRHGVLIAGNGVTEVAQSLGAEDCIVVESDGSKLVVVQRTDLDLASADDDRARQLALADNRAAQVGLDWNPDVLRGAQERGANLDWLFRTDELATIFGDDQETPPPPLDNNGDGGSSSKGSDDYTLTLVFTNAREMKDAADDLARQGYRFKRRVL